MRSLCLLPTFLQEKAFLEASMAIPLYQLFIYTGSLTLVIIYLETDACNEFRWWLSSSRSRIFWKLMPLLLTAVLDFCLGCYQAN